MSLVTSLRFTLIVNMKVLEAKTIVALNGDYMSANEVLSFKSKVMATAVNLSWLLTQYKLYL